MGVLVVGTIALDSIETPHGRADDAVGGSATHFSIAAAYYARVRLVGVIGPDFPDQHLELLRGRGVDTAGVQVTHGRSMRWSGRYHENMNMRDTLSLDLGVFARFDPQVPESFRDTPFVFLANGHPRIQMQVREQMPRARFVMADTMNLWIDTEREGLDRLLRAVDGIIMNDEEARQYTGSGNTVDAGHRLLDAGPRVVIIKKGEHGAMCFSAEGVLLLPAFPVRRVIDPTGAGDSFAGALMGRLASIGRVDRPALRDALLRATVAASFNVEDFSLDRFRKLTRPELDARCADFSGMCHQPAP